MTTTNEEAINDDAVKDLIELCRKPLRDFSEVAVEEVRSDSPWGRTVTMAINRDEMPMPEIIYTTLRFALPSANIGRSVKSRWELFFRYKGRLCSLAFRKFGLRLRIDLDAPTGLLHSDEEYAKVKRGTNFEVPEAVRSVAVEIYTKINAACNVLQGRVLKRVARESLDEGNVTILNQYFTMRRMYEHFRERSAASWQLHESLNEPSHDKIPTSGHATMTEHTERISEVLRRAGEAKHQSDVAFYDAIAMINAYFSYMEHLFVLALPSTDFDPSSEPLASFVQMRVFEKFDRVFAAVNGKEHQNFKHRFHAVAERWRNPYSHGGFDKHHATIYFHTPTGVMPVGLSDYRTHPTVTFIPERNTTFDEVCELFDEFDAWVETSIIGPSVKWARFGLDVAFDAKSLAEFRAVMVSGTEHFERYLAYHSEMADQAMNMDW